MKNMPLNKIYTEQIKSMGAKLRQIVGEETIDMIQFQKKKISFIDKSPSMDLIKKTLKEKSLIPWSSN